MNKTLRSILWLVAVVILSAAALTVIDRLEENQNVPPPPDLTQRATVLLVVYAGEEVPSGLDPAKFQKVGCEDLLVPYEIDVPSKRLKSVLHALSQFEPPEGYHNPLQEKGITVTDAAERGHSKVIVELAGEPQFGGVCDTPRFMEQIRETVKLTNPDFEIRLNGSESAFRCLSDMSGECK